MGVVPQRDGTRFVFLDAFEHLAEGRMDGTHNQAESRHHDHEGHVIHGHIVLQINQAEQLATWHALQTIFTTGERRLQTDEEQHLRQGQGDHREVDTLTPNGKPAEDQPQQGTTKGAQQQADFRGQPPDFHRVTSHVRGATEEGRVAEREKPGVAQQQVECTGKQGEAHELHDEHGIRTNKRCCNQAQQQQAVSHIGDSF